MEKKKGHTLLLPLPRLCSSSQSSDNLRAILRMPQSFLIVFLFVYVQKEKAAEEEIEMDPDIAAMMGFGGFTSKKS